MASLRTVAVAAVALAAAAVAVLTAPAGSEQAPSAPGDGVKSEPLKLEPGKPVEIVCETRAVSVADEAQATTGQVRLRLEPATRPAAGAGSDPAAAGARSADGQPVDATAAPAQSQAQAPSQAQEQAQPQPAPQAQSQPQAAVPAGTWTIADVPAAHAASFALKHKEVCSAQGCPYETGQGASLSLWAPSKVMPDTLPPGASMSLGALDLGTMTLRVSSFRDRAIAALEQGDCKQVP